ncbi:hypothetical protein J1614_003912 [Plenodomus biglobosus]|nr:hypothetical protein J1614_003912 [Plenodomus biglobosus]
MAGDDLRTPSAPQNIPMLTILQGNIEHEHDSRPCTLHAILNPPVITARGYQGFVLCKAY